MYRNCTSTGICLYQPLYISVISVIYLFDISYLCDLFVHICVIYYMTYRAVEKLSSLGCDHVFTGHVTRWLNVLRHVVIQRVYRAVLLDTVTLYIYIFNNYN